MNRLLLWMSARGVGSAASFRRFVSEIDSGELSSSRHATAHYTAAWTLSKLGHAEFGLLAATGGWRVAPPVLAASGWSGAPEAVLCGARTEPLLGRLADAAGDLMVSSPQPDSPDRIQLHATSAAHLVSIACRAGVPVQWNAPLAILAACPRVTEADLTERPLPIGAGWSVSRFSKSQLGWVACTAAEAAALRTCLMRFRSDYETIYAMIADGRTYLCEPATGKYRVLARRHRVLSYSLAEAELSLPVACRPPALIERALVVASGSLPESRGAALVYTKITPSIATATAAVLGQRLY